MRKVLEHSVSNGMSAFWHVLFSGDEVLVLCDDKAHDDT